MHGFKKINGLNIYANFGIEGIEGSEGIEGIDLKLTRFFIDGSTSFIFRQALLIHITRSDYYYFS